MVTTGIRTGLVLIFLTGVALLVVPGGIAPALAAPCITIYIAGSDELGFRNSCDACTVAVWEWGGGQAVFSLNGKVHSVFKSSNTLARRYEIRGRGELRVRNEAATGALVSEEVCPTP
jgi:hypothetical protein